MLEFTEGGEDFLQKLETTVSESAPLLAPSTRDIAELHVVLESPPVVLTHALGNSGTNEPRGRRIAADEPRNEGGHLAPQWSIRRLRIGQIVEG